MMLKIYSVSCFTNMDISAWCFCVAQWVFVVEGRWFCPHRGHGAMCGDIFDCHTGVLLTISGQTSGMLLNILTCTDGPSNKELWGQNTDSAEVEQPSYGELLHKAWFLHLRYLLSLFSYVSIKSHNSYSTGTKHLFFSDFDQVEKSRHGDGWAFEHQRLVLCNTSQGVIW